MATLHKKIAVSGAETFVWICDTCHRFAPFGGPLFIAADKVYGFLNQGQLDALEVLMPESIESRCAVCKSRNVELHHWAPKQLFGDDAERWPKDYLCIPCHNEWHKRMKL